MSDMLDRMAEALKPFFSGADKYEGEHARAARAVLEEITVPSFDMSQAGAAAIEHDVTWHQSPPNVCAKAFRAMIEEALK